MKINFEKSLSVFLKLMALHSIAVGIGLIVIPSSALEFLGFNGEAERFFSTQGGVFHILMAIGYLLAASKLKNNEPLIIFSVIVKFGATLFLLIYYLLVESIILLLFSCVSDFIMGLVIFLLHKKLKSKEYFSKGML